jgi:hypothetical protein
MTHFLGAYPTLRKWTRIKKYFPYKNKECPIELRGRQKILLNFYPFPLVEKLDKLSTWYTGVYTPSSKSNKTTKTQHAARTHQTGQQW